VLLGGIVEANASRCAAVVQMCEELNSADEIMWMLAWRECW